MSTPGLNENLTECLNLALKTLMKLYINEEVTIKSCSEATVVCNVLEAVFLIGLKPSFATRVSTFDDGKRRSYPSFWPFIKGITHKSVTSQLKKLSCIRNEIGLCRAWIRMALNDSLMTSYLDSILTEEPYIRKCYLREAYLLDSLQLDVLSSLVQGLGGFTFNLPNNSSVLNMWSRMTLELAGYIKLTDGKLPTTVSISPTPSVSFITPESTSLPSQSPSKNSDNECIATNRRKRRPRSNGHSSLTMLSDDSLSVGSLMFSDNLASTPNCSKDISEGCSNPLNNQVALEHNGINDTSPFNADSPLLSSEVSMPSKSEPHENGATSSLSISETFPITHTFSEEVEEELLNVLSDELAKTEHLDTHSDADPSLCQLILDGTNRPSSDTDFQDYKATPPTDVMPSWVDAYHIAPNSPKRARSSSSSAEDIDDLDKEAVDSSNEEHQKPSNKENHFLHSIYTRLIHSKGIGHQKYKCNSCRKPIGMIYGKVKICKYDMCYYCFDCHVDDESMIPGKALNNWDFSKHKVSTRCKAFLTSMETVAAIDVDNAKLDLYDFVPELNAALSLRRQLWYLYKYLSSCKDVGVKDFLRKKVFPREYLLKEIHLYSLCDLHQVYTGQMLSHLKNLVQFGIKHVHNCELCRQKGYVCESCKSHEIIYPFDIERTIVCPVCSTVYHRTCKTEFSNCHKCERRIKNSSQQTFQDIQDSPSTFFY